MLAPGQLIVGEPSALRSEGDSHRLPGGIAKKCRKALPDFDNRGSNLSAADGRGSEQNLQIRCRLIKTGEDFGIFDQRICLQSHALTFRTVRVAGIDQPQPGDTHVGHGPGHRSDVAGFIGFYQDYVDTVGNLGTHIRQFNP